MMQTFNIGTCIGVSCSNRDIRERITVRIEVRNYTVMADIDRGLDFDKLERPAKF